jgi:hypothetical protein
VPSSSDFSHQSIEDHPTPERFALRTQHTSLALTVVVTGPVSVCMSLAGLELVDRPVSGVERWSQGLGAVLLIATGVMATGVF